MTPTAIDLFSGAGGASLGLVRAGWDLRLASDFNQACSLTHQANLPGEFITGDLRDVDAAKVITAADAAPGELDVMFAGPPCQGFSIIGSRVVWDKRNNLFREVLRLASEVRPRCVVIENVPGLVTLAGGAYLRAILQGLDEAGYGAACAELLAAQYGAPQMRWRLIIIGWRKDLGIPAGHGFPQPTAGMAAIGELLPNVTIPQWQLDGFVTTAQAIGDLPPVEAGEEATRYFGPSAGPYQELMRAGLGDELSNHYAARLSEANLTRLRHIKPGQDWRDLPHELLPAGMQRALRKDHTRRYRRMTWDGIPRAVITRFRDPKSGEYTHPEQDRTITIREAARLQGFPDRFVFHGDRSSQYDQVGNAVPTQLAEAIGGEVRRCLEGNLGERLRAPFRRRPVKFLGMNGELAPGLPGLSETNEAGGDQLEFGADEASNPATRDAASRPHVAEWFGHRIFPTVSSGALPIADQRSGRCPFLSQTLQETRSCIKAENSRGVCTISASSNGPRQDWLVCPSALSMLACWRTWSAGSTGCHRSIPS